MPDRRLRLLKGYPSGTHPSPRAYDAGLRERFAAMLDTTRPDAEGMFLDVELFLRLIDALLEVVPHDQVLFEQGDERPVTLEPPEQIFLARDAHVVCVVETECRVNVGGTPPYHDAYTVVLYTRTDFAQAFREAAERTAASLGVPCTSEADGPAEATPPEPPLWKLPLQWMGGKAR